MHPSLEWYLALSGVLFVIGLMGVLTRRNVLVIFMSVEMMLNAVNVSFIAFGRAINSAVGQVFALFVISIAAAEVGVGLAIVLLIYRNLRSPDLDQVDQLKG